MSQLSPRQRQITEMIAQGKTEREIAHDLRIAHSTVREHKRRMFAKTGCVSSVELAVKFVLEVRGL